ncbi:ABC transporter ATP-binding protein [Acidiferrimicrobium sp. IK]|uniref:ABC transporter ATP-binding protein n=1 Tax=Acidiferrimicrobium sp. IK TaxID=2871700 RepID=UPI0021CB72C5|nr:ABC transporter ATP-binding protein [Acidiferrimicrobium sp. IK]MCU4186354.1 ABC transporter ATP-binding protein [Acidiferrimicrobium sp. IK]
MAPLLSCQGVAGGYGKLTVVQDIDLVADAGTVVAMLGPNGAGKTTLMLTLAGLLSRHGGEVSVSGEPLPSGKPAAASAAGVVLVPDDRALFTGLTVRENVAAAARKGAAFDDEIREMFPALATRWNNKAGSLSGGEQQQLAMARAIVQKPKVLLIDEMSMGLAPLIVENLLPVVRSVADRTGAVVVLVEQHIHLALEVADQVMVLVHGHPVLRGSAADLAADPGRLESAYLGEVSSTRSR